MEMLVIPRNFENMLFTMYIIHAFNQCVFDVITISVIRLQVLTNYLYCKSMSNTLILARKSELTFTGMLPLSTTLNNYPLHFQGFHIPEHFWFNLINSKKKTSAGGQFEEFLMRSFLRYPIKESIQFPFIEHPLHNFIF